ncbi:PR-1-like protein [Auriscalpium vulgare]|uniref:PR-1-like protein n=1 Tax=Auriscalpium vulgare TaxID=40419 RepID=A0ACB8S9I6_9AGAM|nr:PR-1-like protein [Auriscalpium vulgare]
MAVAFSAVTGVFGSPSCSHGMTETEKCMTKCRTKFGWPGFAMGTDAWGAVAKPYTGDIEGMVSKACGSTTSSSSNSTDSDGPAIAAPVNFPSSTSLSSVTAPTSSSTFSTATVTRSSSSSASASTSSSSAVHLAGNVNHATSSSSIEPTTSTSPPPAPKPTTSTTPPPPPPSTKSTPTTSADVTQPTEDSGNSGSANSGSSSSTSGDDISQYLSAHNSFRAQHGASALSWSDNLAGKAQQWANNCVFQHSGGSLGPFGENLAAGTGSSYGISEAIKSWTDESSDYDPSNPVPSHFTQVVWKASTQVGCAVQSCDGIFAASFGKAKFFVCEYSPAGNVIGEFAQNVQA